MSVPLVNRLKIIPIQNRCTMLKLMKIDLFLFVWKSFNIIEYMYIICLLDAEVKGFKNHWLNHHGMY